MLFVNFKTYEEATGERAVDLTRVLEDVAIENIAIGEISVSSLVKLKKSNLIYLIILLSLVIAFPNIVKTIYGGYT